MRNKYEIFEKYSKSGDLILKDDKTRTHTESYYQPRNGNGIVNGNFNFNGKKGGNSSTSDHFQRRQSNKRLYTIKMI